VDAARRRVLVGYGNGGLAVIDPAARTKAGEIRLKGHPESFHIDETGNGSLSTCRKPARSRSWTLRRWALSTPNGRVTAEVATCSDADDAFVDAKRRRVYVSCGEGVVDVFGADAAGYRRLAPVPTVSGARTSLFVPELDRLYVAARARSNEPAAIWVFRPAP
jgi:hypothetical protein